VLESGAWASGFQRLLIPKFYFYKVTGTITFRGDCIRYCDDGKGRVVVLVHGFLGSAEIWDTVAQRLKRTFRVVRVDLPGHGGSSCFGYVHPMELMAAAVKAVLDHLQLRRYVVIGHSMGGYVALAFAEMFPGHLKGLCLFHSTAYADSPEKKRDRDRAVALVRSNKRLYTTNTIRSLFSEANLKYVAEEISFAASIAAKTSRQGIVAALRGMRDRPSRDVVLALAAFPVMMVAGENDTVLPAGALEEQAQAIRGCEFLVLEHDGHFGFLESPVKSFRALRRFVRRCYR
jgi:pimeloyl-ACP methyl ester carboxylesterase